jgi:hypothetical protein
MELVIRLISYLLTWDPLWRTATWHIFYGENFQHPFNLQSGLPAFFQSLRLLVLTYRLQVISFSDCTCVLTWTLKRVHHTGTKKKTVFWAPLVGSHFTVRDQKWTSESGFVSAFWIPGGFLLSAWRNPFFGISRSQCSHMLLCCLDFNEIWLEPFFRTSQQKILALIMCACKTKTRSGPIYFLKKDTQDLTTSESKMSFVNMKVLLWLLNCHLNFLTFSGTKNVLTLILCTPSEQLTHNHGKNYTLLSLHVKKYSSFLPSRMSVLITYVITVTCFGLSCRSPSGNTLHKNTSM